MPASSEQVGVILRACHSCQGTSDLDPTSSGQSPATAYSISNIHLTTKFMSKRNHNAVKSSKVVAHTQTPSDGHVAYPELIRPQTRLESVSRTLRSFIPSFPASTSPNPNAQSSPSTGAAHHRSYGSYASTSETSNIPEGTTNLNAVGWSRWISVQNQTLLLVSYQQCGFHIWDFTSLDAVKEVLHLPSIGPVVSASIISSPPSRSASKYRVLFLLSGTGDEAALTVYSLALHTTLKRISIPNARTVQANHRFLCVGVQSTKSQSSPAIHVFSSTGEYTHLHVIPALSVAPHTTSSPIFSLASSRLLAYASSEPPAHLQSAPSPPSSYPPSNPFTPLPSPGTPSTSNIASGLSVVGSTLLTGATRLGTGVFEGVKMGISAVGYGPDGAGSSPDDRDRPSRGPFSRSAPSAQVSPLSSRGHARRASAQVRSAVSGGVGGVLAVTDGGEWITVVDLQPLLDQSLATDSAPTLHSPISPSSSFLATTPPLTQIPPLPTDAKSPELVLEFLYTSASSATKPEFQSKGRASPSKLHTSPSAASRLHSSYLPSTISAPKSTSSLQWSPDGSLLAVGGIDGASVRVFKVIRRRKSAATGAQESEEKARERCSIGEATLVYELMRGITPASVHDIDWSSDGLWNGFVSDKGTLHVFALDPQGDEPDGHSQIYGRVLNPSKRLLPSVRIQALARLRQPLFGLDPSRLPSAEQAPGFDAANDPPRSVARPVFAFIPSAISRSASRLPAPPEQQTPPPSLSSTVGGVDLEPAYETSVTGFNDTLVFLPDEGRVMLWRCTLRTSSSTPGTISPVSRRIEPSPSIVGDAPVAATPASGGLPSSLPGGKVLGGVARMVGLGKADVGLIGPYMRRSGLSTETALVASWDVRREDSWPEVKGSPWVERNVPLEDPSRRSYVSHAELTTFNMRSSAVARPIYLSHQFTFSSLMNDYQALVRRLVLDPPTYPVAMRKESVVVRGGDDLLSIHPHDSHTSLPSDFDSDANFLGTTTNLGPLDLTDSPLLGRHLGLPAEGVPISSSVSSTNHTSLSSQSRSGRKAITNSFDDGLSSAMESRLQLYASYSPSGSSSDVASPGRVIPMLPNGRPGSSGSGVSAGLDAVVRSTTRVGKEVWSGLGSVRSPRLMPTKRSSASADMLKFDEEDEMFMVDGIEDAPTQSAATGMESMSGLVKDGSLATIGPGIGIRYPLSGMTDSGLTIIGPSTSYPAEEGTWVEQSEVYAQAIEEDARFDDVTKVLDEEREERRALRGGASDIPASMSSSIVSESGKPRKKGSGKKKRR